MSSLFGTMSVAPPNPCWYSKAGTMGVAAQQRRQREHAGLFAGSADPGGESSPSFQWKYHGGHGRDAAKCAKRAR